MLSYSLKGERMDGKSEEHMFREGTQETVSMQHILVIDDDPAITKVLKRGLSYEGFAVETVHSGMEGLHSARECPSDLVILDVMMPGMSGLEVLQRLRAADDQLPVLLLTAKDA